MQPFKRPYVLSIAGFDPSAGAGVLADIKAIEGNGGYGLGVVSALTYQNDIRFEGVEWISFEKITAQVSVLLERLDVRVFKIGLIESFGVLQQLVAFIRKQVPDAIIVWDPIVKASAGFVFHDAVDNGLLKTVMEQITCITPNIPEAIQLLGREENLHQVLLAGNSLCAVFLKGGHHNGPVAEDILYHRQQSYSFSTPRLPNGEKHGSGCVFSAALAMQLALGKTLPDAAAAAKQYTHRFLGSNDSLLGYHSYTTLNEKDQ